MCYSPDRNWVLAKGPNPMMPEEHSVFYPFHRPKSKWGKGGRGAKSCILWNYQHFIYVLFFNQQRCHLISKTIYMPNKLYKLYYNTVFPLFELVYLTENWFPSFETWFPDSRSQCSFVCLFEQSCLMKLLRWLIGSLRPRVQNQKDFRSSLVSDKT